MNEIDSSAVTKPKRRLLKFGIGAALLAALVVFVGPLVSAPLVRSQVASAIEDKMRVQTSFESLSFNAAGDVHAENLTLLDLAGLPFFQLSTLDVDAAVLSAVRGRYVATVDVDGFELHVREEAHGGWNVSSIMRESQQETETKSDDATDSKLPNIGAKVNVRNGRVIVHGASGETILDGISLRFDLEDLEQPGSLAFEAQVSGPGGKSGGVHGEATFTAATDGRLAADTFAGAFQFAIDDLILSALSPVLAQILPLQDLEGTLVGTLEAHLTPGLAIDGNWNFVASNLSAVGSLQDRGPVRIARVALTGEAASEAQGNGNQQLEFTADEFLSIAYEGTTKALASPDGQVQGKLTVDGELADLFQLASGWVPIKDGTSFGGKLMTTANLELSLSSNEPQNSSVDVQGGLQGFTASDESGKAIDLGELANLSYALSGKADLAHGSLDVPSFGVNAGPVQAGGRLMVTGMASAGEDLAITDSKLELSADLDRLASSLAAFVDLSGTQIGGSLNAQLSASSEQDGVRIQGSLTPDALRYGDIAVNGAPLNLDLHAHPGTSPSLAGALTCERIDIDLAADKKLSQRDLVLDIDLGQDKAADVFQLRKFDFQSSTGAASANGTVTGMSQPEERVIDVKVAFSSSIQALLADFNEVLGMPNHQGTGDIQAQYTVVGDHGRIAAKGQTTIEDLELTLVPEDGGAPTTVSDSRLATTLDAEFDSTQGDITLNSVDVNSEFVTGHLEGKILAAQAAPASDDQAQPVPVRFEGLRGELKYVPDKLGVLLEPYLPGKLSGSAEEHMSFQVDGEATSLGPLEILSQAKSQAKLGLGTFETSGFVTSGEVNVDVAGGIAKINGDLGANGGKLTIDGSLGLDTLDATSSGSTQSKINMHMEGVQANSGLAPLLSLVHPAFGGFQQVAGNELKGLMSADFELSYNAPLSKAALEGGWDKLSKVPINGSGRLALDEASLKGTPFMGELLSSIGVDVDKEIRINPISFQITDGRLHYDKPWSWTMSGSKTTFMGSIGLDKTLDMVWSVPVTEKLVAKHSFLKTFAGDTIEIPLKGTALSPQLDWQGVLQGLAQSAVQKGLKNELENNLGGLDLGGLGGIGGGLGDLLGGGSKSAPDAKKATTGTQAQGPEALLKQADDLWSNGKKTEAAAIYADIRKRFQFSPVYLLNKKYIKKRAKYKP